jgi:hypothetical protein
MMRLREKVILSDDEKAILNSHTQKWLCEKAILRSEKCEKREVRKRLCEKWFWEVLLWKVVLRYEKDETASSKFWVIKINLFNLLKVVSSNNLSKKENSVKKKNNNKSNIRKK